MMKVFFFAIISSLLMSCSHYTKLEKQHMELINDLSDKEKCDEAFKIISNLGKEIIPYLLENSTSEEEYKGAIIYFRSSLLIANPQVGVISLYLIESILKQHLRPYELPLIISEKDKFPYDCGKKFPTTQMENKEKAIEYYKQWWKKVKDLDLVEMRKISPLENTELRWYGQNFKK